MSAATHLDVVAVAAGRSHTAAITRAGAVHTWGCRRTGKLGWAAATDGSGEQVHGHGRVLLPPAPAFASAAALADDHTLVLDGHSGGVLAFGGTNHPLES